ncbi:hydroxymethylglutaryl-CoA lyase [Naumannella cuiyingiana]|uniref:Hydroxymethylglutaryl-CoA lyase n=1 Tax=Naumannella cuiyingiana TaxID=1347891 RepID=A0A7Z0D6G5_9ACTN|nr:citramalate synthase [Naumannella cuiyingiana]NYI69806.1 hydroxymethylglutaryl-CoA lyase [Naumannella cuiyingiana]
MSYPKVTIVEEGMREGMQIESETIGVEAKIELLDALSRTGLSRIVMGSFVSPKWTPQMAQIDEVAKRFTRVPGVQYTALALNEKGRERAAEHDLATRVGLPRSLVHVCDVFVRRNANRSQQDEIDAIPATVRRAVDAGATEAMIAVNAAWGSNWLGEFSDEQRMELLQRQHDAWTEAGIAVTGISFGDPMGWNVPHKVAGQLRAALERWPEIRTVHLHLHDARGTALTSAYAALEVLDDRHELILDTAIGGMGGCPYCGHGRMTRMIPTEDAVDMLHEMGIETGVDLDKLIEAAALAEEVVGHELWGHVSKAGPRPRGERLYAMDMPFIETAEQAQHFRKGPQVYAGARSPWREPITSPARDAVERSLQEGTTR